ncbi:amino acid transporter [Microbacterium sp. 1.5R]|uniref:amino acid permease n=1 Tax=Microbacterium TaxID=33882 RepID=UPI00069E62DE|nr:MULTISPECIES: amino acid permease [unclassified Microbacterium]AKV86127.1 amino acid transporter [Microbacterium sp. CGR1]APH45559.1 amino acid transporter [Microbacterium sp. 1.5R]MBC6496227.1 amino acid transporter [Microbacterium sp. 4-7]
MTEVPTTTTTTKGLHPGLTRRQISMMGLGGAIGAGLFVGSGQAISIAGPAVLISYLVAGGIVVLIMAMLAEMVAARPSSGAFSSYAQKAMGRSAGSAVGWLYWIQLVVVIAAEATGAAGIIAAWIPGIPAWVWVLVFVVALTAVNLFGVRNYGTFEFWFAAIKVAAIIVFLVVGVCAILGFIPGVPATGIGNLVDNGGFAPNGLTGIAAALLIVVFAFGGTEVVAIAAAESDDPARNIRRIVREVLVRILIFYVGSIFVIVSVLPWNDPAVKDGPFSAVLDTLQLPGVGLVMDLIVVIALLSAMNANIYGASRMAYSLGERGLAPLAATRTTSTGVPVVAVLASVAFGFITVGLNWAFPDVVLPALLNVVGSTLLIIWTATAVSQIILRRRADREGAAMPMRMWGFPWLSWLCLALLAGVIALTMIDEAARVQLLLTIGLTAVLLVVARLTRGVSRPGVAGERDGVVEG